MPKIGSVIAEYLRSKHYLDSDEMKKAIFDHIIQPEHVAKISGIVIARFCEEEDRNLVTEKGHSFCQEHFLPEYAETIQSEGFPLIRRIWILVCENVLDDIALRELESMHSKVLDEVNRVVSNKSHQGEEKS